MSAPINVILNVVKNIYPSGSALRMTIILLLCFLWLIFLTPSVSAQTASPSASYLPSTNYPPSTTLGTSLPTTIPPTSPLYTDLLVNNLFHSFSCLAIGQSVIGQPCLTYQVTKNAEGVVQSVPVLSSVNLSGGTLGAVSSVIGALYLNPPVKSADYLASVGQGLGIVKTANAQVVGSGAAVLNPILSLWQVSRNISYVIMIIIFVVIGIMVMFRNRINPQTVITAQTALPGLVIGLILITFSYFLAGLISDMAFVGTNVVGYYFSAVKGQTNPPQNLVEDVSTENVLRVFSPFTKIMNIDRVQNALGLIWDDLAVPGTCRQCPWDMDPQKAITALATLVVMQILMPFGSMFGGAGQIVSGAIAFGGTALIPVQIVSLVLSFLAMVMLIYAMLKLLMRLINNYITIIFLTITAPFQFLAAALPGRQGIATNWVLNMLANILAFPAVLAVFYFIAFLLGSINTSPIFKTSDANQFNNGSIVPSVYAQGNVTITNTNTFPLFGGFELEFLNILLAFGALIALPTIPDIIARTIGRLGVAGQLIGQEIGGTYAAGQRYTGQVQSGVSGFAGQVGRLTNEPGLYLDPESGEWRRPENIEEARIAGTRAGQATRAREGLRSFGTTVRGWWRR